MVLSADQTMGHVVVMQRTDPRHLGGTAGAAAPEADPVQGFGELLARTLGQVNDLQLQSMDLSRRMITDPDAVDIHDVTIAMAQANLALSMTKAIVDKAIQAYRETISIR